MRKLTRLLPVGLVDLKGTVGPDSAAVLVADVHPQLALNVQVTLTMHGNADEIDYGLQPGEWSTFDRVTGPMNPFFAMKVRAGQSLCLRTRGKTTVDWSMHDLQVEQL